MRDILLTLLSVFLVCAGAASARAQRTRTEPERAPEQNFEESLTPLMRAAAARRLDEVRGLVKAGADVNEKAESLGFTALVLAAGAGHLEVVKVLLEGGA